MVHRIANSLRSNYRLRRRSHKRSRNRPVVAIGSESGNGSTRRNAREGGRGVTAKLQIGIAGVVVLLMALLTGCSLRLPGQPTEAGRWRAPAEINDFNQLYTQNCAGCHGVDGRLGAARPLNNLAVT